jgi:hypothetical protein
MLIYPTIKMSPLLGLQGSGGGLGYLAGGINPLGDEPNNPAYSGKHLKNAGVTASGNYYIKPNGYTGTAIQCYVDMDVAGGGWVLCGVFASESGFEMRNFATNGKNPSDVKDYSTTRPSTITGGPKLLPKDFCNKLYHQNNSTTSTTYTDYQMLTVCSSISAGTIIVEYQANTGNRTSSHDAWRLVYASGSMNNQWQSKHVIDTSQNSGTWWKTQTSIGGSFVNYNSGRSGNDGNNDYHYLPDDYTTSNEWLFRENLDDDCGTANNSNVPSIFLIR